MNAASADEIIDRTGAIGYTFCTVAYARSFIHIASRAIFKYRSLLQKISKPSEQSVVS